MSVQVNVNLENSDAANLDQMAKNAGYDNRSAFVRWLIRREWLRNFQSAELKPSLPEGSPIIISDESIPPEQQP